MYYIVYKTTNLINGKIYIGAHKTKDLDDGYLGSGKILGRAIEKYGIENFKKEILVTFDTKKEMFEMESELVNEDFISRGDTYNLKLGGEGGFDHLNDGSDEHIERCRLAGSSQKSLECLDSGRETQKHLRESNSEWVEWYNGRKTEVLKKYYVNGGKNGFKGKRHTEEFKKRFGEAVSKSQKGSGNSQYGTIWITNEKENRKIKKDDPIPDGWRKGARFKRKKGFL